MRGRDLAKNKTTPQRLKSRIVLRFRAACDTPIALATGFVINCLQYEPQSNAPSRPFKQKQNIRIKNLARATKLTRREITMETERLL